MITLRRPYSDTIPTQHRLLTRVADNRAPTSGSPPPGPAKIGISAPMSANPSLVSATETHRDPAFRTKCRCFQQRILRGEHRGHTRNTGERARLELLREAKSRIPRAPVSRVSRGGEPSCLCASTTALSQRASGTTNRPAAW